MILMNLIPIFWSTQTMSQLVFPFFPLILWLTAPSAILLFSPAQPCMKFIFFWWWQFGNYYVVCVPLFFASWCCPSFYLCRGSLLISVPLYCTFSNGLPHNVFFNNLVPPTITKIPCFFSFSPHHCPIKDPICRTVLSSKFYSLGSVFSELITSANKKLMSLSTLSSFFSPDLWHTWASLSILYSIPQLLSRPPGPPSFTFCGHLGLALFLYLSRSWSCLLCHFWFFVFISTSAFPLYRFYLLPLKPQRHGVVELSGATYSSNAGRSYVLCVAPPALYPGPCKAGFYPNHGLLPDLFPFFYT